MASFSSTADTYSDFRMSAVSSLQRMEPAPTESLGTRLRRLAGNNVAILATITIGHGLTETRWHETAILFSAAI